MGSPRDLVLRRHTAQPELLLEVRRIDRPELHSMCLQPQDVQPILEHPDGPLFLHTLYSVVLCMQQWLGNKSRVLYMQRLGCDHLGCVQDEAVRLVELCSPSSNSRVKLR